MQFNEFRAFDFAPTEESGAAVAEETDETETYLDKFGDGEGELGDGAITSKPEPSEKETTSEKEPVPSDMAGEAKPEPSTETTPGEAEAGEPTEAKKLYADKYHSLEDFEQGYKDQQTEALRVVKENNDLKAEKERAATQVTPEPEPEPVTTEPEATELTPDQIKVNEAFYDKSPADGFKMFGEQLQKQMAESAALETLKTAEEEATTFNRNLEQERARELIVVAAKTAELPEDRISQLENKDNLITKEILGEFPLVEKQLYAEIAFINSTFKQQPITSNEKVISENGKYSPGAFKQAHTLLNHDKIVTDTKLNTATATVEAIKSAKPGVKVITPTQESHAEIEVKWDDNESLGEAERKADAMKPEAVETMLDDWVDD